MSYDPTHVPGYGAGRAPAPPEIPGSRAMPPPEGLWEQRRCSWCKGAGCERCRDTGMRPLTPEGLSAPCSDCNGTGRKILGRSGLLCVCDRCFGMGMLVPAAATAQAVKEIAGPPPTPEGIDGWRCTCATIVRLGVGYHTFACLWPQKHGAPAPTPSRPEKE